MVFPGAGHDFDFKRLTATYETLGDQKAHLSGYNADAASGSLRAIDDFLKTVFP